MVDGLLASELLRRAIGRELPAGVGDFVVSGISADSRKVGRGGIFIAVDGVAVDGADFAEQAVADGAELVVSHRAISELENVIVVEDGNDALVKLAWGFYGVDEILREKKIEFFGVTGTNGKTTVCYLFQHLMNRMGRVCGRFGTVDYDVVSEVFDASHTTPDIVQMAELIRRAADAGADSIVMEVSSHALEQGRADGIDFSVAAFTNLSGDHLDYHKSMDNYLGAKLRLFQSLGNGGVGVVNGDDAVARKVIDACCRGGGCGTGVGKITYGIDLDADLKASDLVMSSSGTRCRVNYSGSSAEFEAGLIGKHNMYNALAAMGMGAAIGFDLGDMCKAMRDVKCAPGRLERVCGGGDGFEVFVDYAHTDDGLINVLGALKPLTAGKLIVVFGCGGDRDRSKRPRMARAAERFGDAVIVTNDNPRTEDQEQIFDDIMVGFSDEFRGGVLLEADRGAAIDLAINMADEGDVVLIAGKGHEKYQVVGNEKLSFDDVQTAKMSLADLNSGKGE